MTILILPPLSIYGTKVSFHHCLLGYEHAALIIPGVGERAPVEEHNFFLNVPVHEMKPEVSTAGCPPCKSLNQEVYGRVRMQEGHPVLLSHR